MRYFFRRKHAWISGLPASFVSFSPSSLVSRLPDGTDDVQNAGGYANHTPM